MAHLSLWLLGSFRVELGGMPVTGFATDKAQALLAYLSVESDRPHLRSALASLLWPGRPQQKALRSLRQALYQVREVIGDRDAADASTAAVTGGPSLLVTRQTIQFNVESDHWLDVTAFTSLAAACRRHRHRSRDTCLPCLDCMEKMVALYRGEFLEHFTVDDSPLFEEWVTLRREWLHRETTEALIQLTNHHERRGETEAARRYGRRQLEMEPWREETHRQLMRLLARDGQRSAALAQYRSCHRALADELGVEPTQETTRLYEQIHAGPSRDIPDVQISHRSTLRREAALPPSPTPFVGRETELAELAELLANPDCRLVTLVGPGGIGKTRLALEAVAAQVGNFRDGVAFVPLTTVRSPDLLVSAIAEALRFSFHDQGDPEQQLLSYLREKELLLGLDGMEHMLEGTRLLAKILRQAHGVILLVTSRERLNLREEWVRSIQGLTYPRQKEIAGRPPGGGMDEAAAEAVKLSAAYSAVALFQQHARRGDHHFSLSSGVASDVVRICQLVEGLPLGVELAAAWAGTRSCGEIAEEIERNLDILSTSIRNVPDRQRSIRATFEHSWQLLSQPEKDLLARLSVFRGGFHAEAALRVSNVSRPTLLALVDKSLITHRAPGRYDMHGLLTQFAAEKLRADGRESDETEMSYARYFADFLERYGGPLRTAKDREAFRAVAVESENVRRAWQLAVARDCAELVEQGLESLYIFYDVQCRFQEGIDLFACAIDRWGRDPLRERAFARVISRQGALYLRLGLHREAAAALAEGFAISRRLEMPMEQVRCLVNLANLAQKRGQYQESDRLSRRSLALSRQIGDQWGTTHSLLSLGLVRYRMGDIDEAEDILDESLAVGRETGSPRLLIAPLNILGDVACHRGDYAEGLARFGECLTLGRALDHDFRVALILNNLGTVFQVLGRIDEAQSAYEESLATCRQIGDQGGQAVALSNLGEIAYEAGRYAEAASLYRQGLAIGREVRDQWIVMACLNNLGEAALALEDNEAARACFSEALTIARETQTLPLAIKILVNFAVLLAREGEERYAVRLLGLARQHPASEQAIQDKAQQLLDQLGVQVPEDIKQPLDATLADLLADVSPP